MDPNDPISKSFDLSALAGEAIREEEAKRVVGQLDRLFDAPQQPTSVILGYGLTYLNQTVDHLVSGLVFNVTDSKMSQPYEQFEHEGVNLTSRIVRVRCNSDSDTFVDASIYLIGLMGENQTTVAMQNCPIGAIKTKLGQIEFFKIEKNPNLGKLAVERALQDFDGERVLAQEGYIDKKEGLVTVLTPEERYIAMSEFEKALASMTLEQT